MAQRGAYRQPCRDADFPPNPVVERATEPDGIGVSKHLAFGIGLTKYLAVGIGVTKHLAVGIGLTKYPAVGIARSERVALG